MTTDTMNDKAPERWRLVPEEPTDAMLNAPEKPTLANCNEHHYYHAYKAMLAAVPSPPAISGEEEKSVTFLRACASWFRSEAAEATEDRAHWARVYNAENCDKAASLVERKGREIARLSRTESTINDDGTYTPPRHGWTCFHCGETFPPYGIHVHKAREHFGEKPGNPTKCQSEITRLSRELAEARAALK